MKFILACTFMLIMTSNSMAQSIPVVSNKKYYKIISKDSINMYFNNDYELIGDSCAKIVRYAHLDTVTSKFIGKFKDVHKDDPSKVINEGNYNGAGLKDGEFILHYLNGKLQAKGTFKNDKYIGTWEFYYPNGDPEVRFLIDSNDNTTIIDAWNKNKVQTATNGHGNYIANSNIGIVWHGKIVNGKPDSIWTFSNPDDTSKEYGTEYFKNGEFIRGESPIGSYDDKSLIVLVTKSDFPFVNAEHFFVAFEGCNNSHSLTVIPSYLNHTVESAKYIYGTKEFTAKIEYALRSVFEQISSKSIETFITINAVIDEKGNLSNFTNSSVSGGDFMGKIAFALAGLPKLEPATVDKKPVKQNFSISLTINNNTFSFSYQFLPIIIKN